MYSEDLKNYSHRQREPFKTVKMVGWLDSNHSYNHGNCPPDIVSKLWHMMELDNDGINIHVNLTRGIHKCDFCNKQISWIGNDGARRILGISEGWIPTGLGYWFAFPSLVVHYIDSHDYLPPSDFLRAVERFELKSPLISQKEYNRIIYELHGISLDKMS